MTENEVIQRLKNRLKTEEQRYGKEFVKEYFDDIDFAISALKEIQQCREMDRKLREVYGDCEGLLEKAVFLLCDHEGVDVGNPIKARLLTDEDVDKWEAYKSIGTVEQVRNQKENLSVAYQVISDYEQYGTIEDFKRAQKYLHLVNAHGTIGQVIDLCAEYEEIGTVEECREAMEKQKPKKPNRSGMDKIEGK